MGGRQVATQMRRTALLIDGAAMFARVYFACDGTPRLRDFVTTAKNVIDRIEPDVLLWAWDGEHRKSSKVRAPKPDGYHLMIAEYRKGIGDALGGRTVIAEEGEADDVLASAAVQERADGHDVVIATSDNDLDYLCVSGIRIFSLVARGFKDKDDVLAKWGVYRLSHVPALRAVIGDTGDGIKGVHGMGIKRAQALYAKVTDGMSFDDARAAIRGQLSTAQKAEYDEALAAIVLYTNLRVPRAIPPRVTNRY